MVQWGQVTSHQRGANKPDPLAPKFGFSGVGDSDFHVLEVQIFWYLRFGFSEPAGQSALIIVAFPKCQAPAPKPGWGLHLWQAPPRSMAYVRWDAAGRGGSVLPPRLAAMFNYSSLAA